MPKLLTTGSRIGVIMSTSGVKSIKQPSTSRMMLISSRMTYLFVLTLSRKFVAICGTFRYVIIQPKAPAAAIRP